MTDPQLIARALLAKAQASGEGVLTFLAKHNLAKEGSSVVYAWNKGITTHIEMRMLEAIVSVLPFVQNCYEEVENHKGNKRFKLTEGGRARCRTILKKYKFKKMTHTAPSAEKKPVPKKRKAAVPKLPPLQVIADIIKIVQDEQTKERILRVCDNLQPMKLNISDVIRSLD